MTTGYSIKHHPLTRFLSSLSLKFLLLQVLAVQEKSGVLRGLGVWKFPTGVVEPVIIIQI